MSSDMDSKKKTVFGVAQDFFKTSPDWVTFFREVLGMDGVVRKAFLDPKALAEFELTEEYAEIQQMLAQLREQANILPPKEPTRVITIRIPQSLHDALTSEAVAYHTSVNKLCISKLMQIIDGELVPSDKPAFAKQKAESRAGAFQD
jgi:predicted HicB family RNase H-like nuclease